ncbi:uncharacterized protein F4807DRAFT_457903 [Annulohypoxylon truncatum]|uniref:uncharacterized protein n=1 Tax=Annulohypoxylon truncatum TaxID=327061 RepID=UPI002007F1BE|nr:uncharacterized protein F4807DRAFT_457903 [Annulohypoxylon truncatum]KAI1212407.1 hypothetical protein F4807DRAFT_457903 [Annulohypoxylon truncatum]
MSDSSVTLLVCIFVIGIALVTVLVTSAALYCEKDLDEASDIGSVDGDAIELGNLEEFVAGEGDEFPMRYDGHHAWEILDQDYLATPAPTHTGSSRRDGMYITNLPALEFSAIELWPGDPSQGLIIAPVEPTTDDPPPYEPTQASAPRPSFA